MYSMYLNVLNKYENKSGGGDEYSMCIGGCRGSFVVFWLFKKEITH